MASASAPESNQDLRRYYLCLAVLACDCVSCSFQFAGTGLGYAATCSCGGAWLGSFGLCSLAGQGGRGHVALGCWLWHSAGTPAKDWLFPSWCTSETSPLSWFLTGFPGDRALPSSPRRSLGVIWAYQTAWEENWYWLSLVICFRTHS